jgi:hypothetical protein
MRFRLRTLLMVLALGPPVLWGGAALVQWLYPPEPEMIWETRSLNAYPVRELVIPAAVPTSDG